MGRFDYFRNFFELSIQKEYQQAEQGLPLPKDVWLKNIQVLGARDDEGNTDGFFVAAKGGHNDESPDHDDIGNFVVLYDGLPSVNLLRYTARIFDKWFFIFCQL